MVKITISTKLATLRYGRLTAGYDLLPIKFTLDKHSPTLNAIAGAAPRLRCATRDCAACLDCDDLDAARCDGSATLDATKGDQRLRRVRPQATTGDHRRPQAISGDLRLLLCYLVFYGIIYPYMARRHISKAKKLRLS